MVRLRIAAAFAAALGLAACGEPSSSAQGRQGLASGVIDLSEQFTGEFSLIDKNGAPVSQADFAGKVMLVYFGFTHCPDVCPGDIGVMSATLNELGEEAGEIAPVFITLDPERDTPQALRDYFAFDERIVPLTGDMEASKAAQAAFKVYASKLPLPDSALVYTIDHSRFYYIVDRNGQPRKAVLGGTTIQDNISPQELANILRRSIETL